MRSHLYVGGRIRTMHERGDAEAMLVEGGRIAAVGTRDALAGAASGDVQVEDLAGRTVVPGFIDAHHHLSLAILYEGAVACAAPDIRTIQSRLAEAAEKIPKGAWVTGYGFDESRLAERRYPTRDDLDAACPDHPVALVHYSFHSVVANSRALAEAGIGRETPDPPAGQIVRGARGEPTGLLVETALVTVEKLARQSLLARDGEGFLERLAAYEARLFAAGITAIADPMVTPSVEALVREAKRRGRMRMPFVLMPIDEGGYLVPPTERLAGPPTGESEDDILVGPLKLVFDGGNACAMCLTARQALTASLVTVGRVLKTMSFAPVRAARRAGALTMGADFKLRSGLRFYPEDAQALAVVTPAVERGFALAIHAMGNEGVAQALRTIEAVRKLHRDLPPPRIEHATFVDDHLLDRAREIGVAIVAQPGFVDLFADGVPALPGIRVLAHRSMLDRGLTLAGSSDAPVIGFEPIEGIRRAVDRRGVAEEEAIDAADALAMYTREAAKVCGLADRGVLRKGARADFVIFSGDPGVDPAAATLDRTVLGGRVVYERA